MSAIRGRAGERRVVALHPRFRRRAVRLQVRRSLGVVKLSCQHLLLLGEAARSCDHFRCFPCAHGAAPSPRLDRRGQLCYARRHVASGVPAADRRAERSEHEHARPASAASLWQRDAGRRGATLRRDRRAAGPCHRLPPDQRRGRADLLGAGMPRPRAGHRDQSGRLHHHLDRPDGRPAGQRTAGDRGARDQHPPPRGIPPALLRLARQRSA